ncbi:MAG: EAL domain-containing protein [Candidatus Binatia bacterium]
MHRLTLVAAITLAAAAVLVTSIVVWSARRSDEISMSRQLSMVSRALDREVQKIPYDQESVAVWDDSVKNVRDRFDETWVDVNLGVWMATYFKHDRAYVVGTDDRALYAMSEGKKVKVDASILTPEILKLIRQLRQQVAGGALDRYENGSAAIPRVVDLAEISGHPSIVSVMPLVPHSSAVTQARGTECLIVGIRYLDTSFPKNLEAKYLLSGARFSQSSDLRQTEVAFPVKSTSQTFLGNLIWTPELPGRSILHDIMPFLALGLGAVAIAMFFVLRRLRNVCVKLVASDEQSRHLAFHDTLTGLPNRAYFVQKLDKALADLRGGEGSLAVLFLDLDRFKQVNDTLGHAVGDELIVHLSRSFRTVAPANSVIARMGGDEFAILKTNIESADDIQKMCESLLAAASESFDTMRKKAMVGLSIGVTIAPNDGLDRTELLRKADIALYQAKMKGGQQYLLFSEDMSKRLVARQEMEAELRCALQTGAELELHYQPVFESKTLRITGVESLVRWNHSRLGLVAPLAFIDIAEETGLIHPLGEWVLRETCRAAKGWPIETVAVNVSPIQLSQLGFTETVLDILYETGLPPHKLELEITETALLDSSHTISKKALRSLRDAGVRIALDDFGTGYSSLNNLISLEVDRIKIDRSFLQPSSSKSVIWAIINMAHAIGLEVTAEGVETKDQEDFLVAVGCNHLQGYHLSKPIPALSFESLLKKRQGGGDAEAA